MEIIINGEKKDLQGPLNLEELILTLGLEKKAVAVELNKKIIKRPEYASTMLSDKDSLEIVHMVGGGQMRT